MRLTTCLPRTESMADRDALAAAQGEYARLIALLKCHGFVDVGHPALLRMCDKRQSGYRAMGYRVASDAVAEGCAYRS